MKDSYIFERDTMPGELELSHVSTETLQQWRANAHYTWCTALGHTKANRNHDLANKYARELVRRGAWMDSDLDGVFNGEGSS